MKNSLFISILFWLSVTFANGQEFNFKMVFSDAVGNMDTLTFGYDPEATDSIDAEFNESNIISSELDAVFDVRITNEWAARIYNNKSSGDYHLKKQIVKKNCPDYSKPIGIDIKCMNWPVTVTWDSSLFVNQNCRYGSLFTDMNEGGWWDVGGPSDLPGYQSLLTSNKITFSKNYYKDRPRDNFSIGAYINQANDTISTFWVVLGDGSVFDKSNQYPNNLANKKFEEYIKLYPNPVTHELQIKNYTGKKLSLKIIDITGRKIIEQPLNDLKSRINLNAYPGVYAVLVTDEKGQRMLEEKIVKR